MKNTFFFLMFSLISLLGHSQETFRLQMGEYQFVANKDGGMQRQLKLPNTNMTVIMGGLNDWDGMNNYFNIFGSKLIVDSLDMGSDGIQNIVLRREDGRDFFNLFPTISAKLVPITHEDTGKERRLP